MNYTAPVDKDALCCVCIIFMNIQVASTGGNMNYTAPVDKMLSDVCV